MKNNFNPPFSLFREYVKQLMDYGKKFIIIGSQNACTDRDIFPYIKENNLWFGVNHVKEFVKPTGETQKFGNICWYTNIENKNRTSFIDLYKRYSNEYRKYDNYDAIEVSKVSDIPMDYDGVMGVPMTFLEKYNPNQFEIIWRSHDIEFAQSDRCFFYNEPSEEECKAFKAQNKTWRKQVPYMVENGIANSFYNRIFIRKRNA